MDELGINQQQIFPVKKLAVKPSLIQLSTMPMAVVSHSIHDESSIMNGLFASNDSMLLAITAHICL